MNEFEELAAARAAIKEFVVPHRESVTGFYDPEAHNFNISYSVPRSPYKDSRLVHGLTSTFTCLESLLEVQPDIDAESRTARKWASEEMLSYATFALTRPEDWYSEGSAWVYCRVRSLGAAVRYAPFAILSNVTTAKQLLTDAWNSSEATHGGAYGIRELTKPPSQQQEAVSYAPNAYLTYWTLLVSEKIVVDARPDDIAIKRKAAGDWLRQTLAEQVAFAYVKSPHADPQQLAWAIAGTVLLSTPVQLVKNERTHDLLTEGLKAFFSHQNERGDWDRGKPLFNYEHAGNAYCYSYETLGELLALATDPTVKSRREFAALLRPYASKLIEAFEYAKATALPLNEKQQISGWGSGHQPHRLGPESWATASVFRFAQRLRVLLGSWVNVEAQRALDGRRAKHNLETLRERGGTWNMGRGGAGLQLATSYVLPLLAGMDSGDQTNIIPDPDKVVIPKDGGRSAILYGPPGTGKTTLVESVAGALGWPFIEITPAQFLDNGLDSVSRRADTIFRQMMELDRCVVLLDEIDELVQNRTRDAQPLERFFTTTMLPRIAKLWDMGKVLFFANTNNVLEIDSAIRRSQRFDAAILVMPPGIEAKLEQILEDTKHPVEPQVQLDAAAAVAPAETKDSPIEPSMIWLPLMRHDQIPVFTQRLSATVKEESEGSAITVAQVIEALQPIGRDLLAQDWTNHRKKNEQSVTKQVRKLVGAQRRDVRLRTIFKCAEDLGSPFKVFDTESVLAGSEHYYSSTEQVPDDPQAWLSQLGLDVLPDGTLIRRK